MLLRPSAMDLEVNGGKERNAVSKRAVLTYLEMDCGRDRIALSSRPICHKKLLEKLYDFQMS